MDICAAAVLKNDSSRDIYDEYLRQFNAGKAPTAIIRQLKRNHLDLEDEQDLIKFWSAVALAQWECGELAPETLRAVQQLTTRADGFESEQADYGELAAVRRTALSELLTQIQSPNPNPKSKHPADRQRAPFMPGDCITFAFPNGQWGAAITVKSGPGLPGASFIKLLNYRGTEKPRMEIFQARQWLHDRRPDGIRSEDPLVMPLPGTVVTAAAEKYERIGHVKLTQADDYKHYTLRTGEVGKIVAEVF